MRIQILSDLHFDVEPLRHTISHADGADVVVVAGDVCEGSERGFQWLRAAFGAAARIVTVAGNHTFYRRCHEEELAAARACAKLYGIDFLENDTVILGNVRFVGCTLWTDYRLFGPSLRVNAIVEAQTKLMDHKRITWTKTPWKRFRPQEAELLHARSLSMLEQNLAKEFEGVSIVVTHHAPSLNSIMDNLRTSLLSAAYASDLDSFIERTEPKIWIHGHVHHSLDYVLASTRVICNPHGYGRENLQFNPLLTVDV